jgi:hypothetical protein
MKRAWLILWTLTAACGSKSPVVGAPSQSSAPKEALAGPARCRQVVEHLGDLDRQRSGKPNDEYQRAEADALLTKCSEAWSNAAVDCLLAVTNSDSFDTCKSLIPHKEKSPNDKTERIVKQIAFEAYPMWSMKHADKACPDKLADLLPYFDGGTTTDAWGHELTMYCGSNLPDGAVGLAIASPGPDGKLGTADDIKSW